MTCLRILALLALGCLTACEHRPTAPWPAAASASAASTSAADPAVTAARGLESVDPGKAVAAWEDLSRTGSAAARQIAAARMQELSVDLEFQKELKAWRIYQSVQKEVAGLKPAAGESSFADPAFAKANASALAKVQELLRLLSDDLPETRGALEARMLCNTLDVPPLEGPPPSQRAVAVVDAVVARTSKPLPWKQIAPYPDALMVIEYKVAGSVTGNLAKDARIVVVHFALRDRQEMPAVSVRPGDRARLTLASWDAQTPLHSYPSAEFDEPDLGVRYFALSVEPLPAR